MKGQRNNLEKALSELLKKYNIDITKSFHLGQKNEISDNVLQLLPGWDLIDSSYKKNHIPLLSWRVRRKFLELKQIVEESVIENVCMLRFCFMGCEKDWPLESLLYREMDLCEFIGDGKIISLKAVLSDRQAGNVIVRLDNNILCSIEVSTQIPSSAPVIERHEIIAQRGTASDLVVDTQVPQSSIYMFREEGKSTYTDVDFELFGFSKSEIDQIRSAFKFFKNPFLKKQWQFQHTHLKKLLKKAFESDEKRKKITLSS